MELSDLPVEVLEMIVERCDYKSRISLHSTSTLMHHLADTAKLFILCVDVHEIRHGVRLTMTLMSNYYKKYTVTYKNTNDHKISQYPKAHLYDEEKTSAELAAKFLGRVCFKKNVTIGYLSIRSVFDIETQLAVEIQTILENAGNHPLKIQTVHWASTGENTDLFDVIMNNCQPIELKCLKMNSRSNPVDLFTKHRSVISSLEKLEVFGDLVATEDDILGLEARELHLTSECFTKNLMQKLMEKLIQEDVPGSYFVMKRREKGLAFENIPKQFDEIPSKVSSFAKYSADRQKRVVISTGTFGCSAAVQKCSDSKNDFMDFNLNYEAECRDKCLKRATICKCYDPMILMDEDDDFDGEHEYYDDWDQSDDSENEGFFDYSDDDAHSGDFDFEDDNFENDDFDDGGEAEDEFDY